jgi:hypothetical protein
MKHYLTSGFSDEVRSLATQKFTRNLEWPLILAEGRRSHLAGDLAGTGSKQDDAVLWSSKV